PPPAPPCGRAPPGPCPARPPATNTGSYRGNRRPQSLMPSRSHYKPKTPGQTTLTRPRSFRDECLLQQVANSFLLGGVQGTFNLKPCPVSDRLSLDPPRE